MSRIGFYGGCFNPPTKAHIELAKKALRECKLDKVIFIPVGDLYEKKDIASGVHRYNMLQLICREEEKLEVSDIEIKNNKNYKAIDIFDILKKQYKECDVFFIMGTDNLKNILLWKESNRLVTEFQYIILDRGIMEAEDIIEKNKILRDNKHKFIIVENNEFRQCSSTDIRRKIRNGEKAIDLDKRVYNYIKENNIY